MITYKPKIGNIFLSFILGLLRKSSQWVERNWRISFPDFLFRLQRTHFWDWRFQRQFWILCYIVSVYCDNDGEGFWKFWYLQISIVIRNRAKALLYSFSSFSRGLLFLLCKTVCLTLDIPSRQRFGFLDEEALLRCADWNHEWAITLARSGSSLWMRRQPFESSIPTQPTTEWSSGGNITGASKSCLLRKERSYGKNVCTFLKPVAPIKKQLL